MTVTRQQQQKLQKHNHDQQQLLKKHQEQQQQQEQDKELFKQWQEEKKQQQHQQQLQQQKQDLPHKHQQQPSEEDVWECQLNDGTWVCFDTRITKELGNAYRKNPNNVSCSFTRCDILYEANFKLWLQIRKDGRYDTRRRIRRRLITLKTQSSSYLPAVSSSVSSNSNPWEILPTQQFPGINVYRLMTDEISDCVNRATQEFNIACGHFCRLLKCRPTLVKTISVLDYDHSSPVKIAFDAEKQRMLSIPGSCANEKWVFHGSTDDAISIIIQNGFKVGGRDDIDIRNGAKYGHGVYTATGPKDPVAYSQRARSKQVILARGLVGIKNSHSWATEGHPDWLIFANGGQLLPSYIVEYEEEDQERQHTQPNHPNSSSGTSNSSRPSHKSQAKQTNQSNCLVS